MKQILCGADRLDDCLANRLECCAGLLRGKRVGLITNPTGVRADFTTTADWFNRHAVLTALYAPEHGVRGDAQDGQSIESYKDSVTGTIVHSIYGKTRTPLPEMLADIDVMVYDMQDVGSRYYTFIYTMANCMQAAAAKGIPFVVLDRPNPIGGTQIAGTPLLAENRSFIGMYDIPQQYALTCGELAMYFNRTQGFGAELTVIPLQHWARTDYACELSVPRISPSPNLPSFESVLLYNGTCLFEGVNVSEGRGTTKPFECVGAPFINAQHFAETLNLLGLPGVRFRPVYFTPMFSKHKGELCGGVQIHVLDYRAVRPLHTGAAMIVTLKQMYPEALRFVPPNHEPGDFTLDLLWGSDTLRTQMTDVQEAFRVIDTYSACATAKIAQNFLY